MRLQRQFTGQPVTLDPSTIIGSGGEGKIYGVREEPNWVAKIYHHPTEEDAEKLTVMYNNPPTTVMAMASGTSIAWPVDLLHTLDHRRQIVGFLMPRVNKAAPIHTFYTPKTRREQKPLFNYLYLHRTARNLIAAVGDLHASGYVVGDVNESNLLVTDTALVMLVDTDSFQVRDVETGRIYRCPVGKAEFTPPELQGQSFRNLDRTPEQDRFGLAILIFQLLMEGTHPFSGVYKGSGDPPAIEARIKAGHFVYGGKSVPYQPMPFAPPFHLLHPRLQQLFIRCFEEGHDHPNLRPDAKAWFSSLKEAEAALVTCAKYSQHRYGNHLNSCPWCDRTIKLGGRDPFPSREAVSQGEHLQPLKRKKRRRLAPASTFSPNRGLARRPATVYRQPPKPPRRKVYTQSQPLPGLPKNIQLGLWHWTKGIVLGGVWGVVCTSAIIAMIFGIFLGSSGILGGMFVGLIWGGFFGGIFNLFIPPHRKLAQLMSLLWGAVCGGFLAAAIAGILYGLLANVEAIGQGIIVGGLLGGLWGGFWTTFKPPLSLPSPGRLRGMRGAILGSIWGAFLGTIAGAVLAVVAIGARELQPGNPISPETVSQLLGIMVVASGLGAVGGVISGTIIGAIGGVPALPNALQLSGRRGAFVGSIWGNFLGVITGSILGGLASPFLVQLVDSGTDPQNTPLILGAMITTAGIGAIWGSFSGIVWGALGRF
ncbi:MAG: DNA-binding protein [Microcoleaceae cyanobacterium]